MLRTAKLSRPSLIWRRVTWALGPWAKAENPAAVLSPAKPKIFANCRRETMDRDSMVELDSCIRAKVFQSDPDWTFTWYRKLWKGKPLSKNHRPVRAPGLQAC